LPPRWQRCVSRTDTAFGFATGAMFVETILPQDIKKAAKNMIQEVKSAFINTLPDNEWMDDTTRQRAKEKAEAVVDRVGHPEWIENPASLDAYYENVVIKPDQFFENYMNMHTFTLHLMLKE
uniref:hypothetical protein n=1 Tax=Salmonella sp. s55044 TaxID=3159677 RepID=UPI00397FEF28